MEKLNKKWLLLYLLVCLITSGFCVFGSIAWWFKGDFLFHLQICSILFCTSVFPQVIAFTINSKRVAQWVEGIPSSNFVRTLCRFFGLKVAVGSSMFLVGISLLLTSMLIWKSYSQFLGTWIGVVAGGYMVVMPLLHWTDRRITSSTNVVR